MPTNGIGSTQSSNTRVVSSSSHTVTALGSVEKLIGRENYNSWAFAMKLLLMREGTWKTAVNVSNQAASEVNTDLSEKAMVTIGLHVDKRNYSLIKSCKTAKSMWDALKAAFEDNGLSREIGLLRKLCGIMLNDCKSTEDYVDQLMSTAQKLEEIGFTVEDRWLVGLLLKGLPEEYNPMVMSIENCGKKLTADEVKSKILQNVQHGIDAQPSTGDQALVAKKKSFKKFQRKGQSKDKCSNCGRSGHTDKECWSKPKGNKTQAAHGAFMVKKSVNTKSSEWILDSGASTHLCQNEAMLTNMKPVRESVKIADNAKIPIKAKGCSMITNGMNKITVSDVSYAPALAVNLLSVSEICRKGNRVTFHSKGCKVVNSKGEMLVTGRLINGLYIVNGAIPWANAATKAVPSIQLWHRRMAHLNIQSLKQLKSMSNGIQFNDQSIPVCKCCCEGKQTRKSFKPSTKRASEVLQLIHSDLCGPMETTSLGGSRYFLTFMDDCTKKTFVYFLKSKDGVFDAFQHFKAYTEKQTGKSIKTLRSDNGTE